MATDFLDIIGGITPPRAAANDFIDIVRDIRGSSEDLLTAAEDPTCIYGDIVTKYNDFDSKYSVAAATVLATAADAVQTGLDAASTGADAIQTALDVTQTGLDATQTAADVLTVTDLVAGVLAGRTWFFNTVDPTAAGIDGDMAYNTVSTETFEKITGAWVSKGLLKGAQGIQGVTGTTGATGLTGNGIATVVYTSTLGLVDTYTITYTDATTDTIEVTNGDQGIQGIQGVTGATGNGIASVTYTSTLGLVDTYTITYTDASTATIEITNGAQGIQGIQGVQGIQGIQGQSVDHITRTTGTGAAGTTDTYTMYADVGETIVMGTFTTYNGVDGNTITDVASNKVGTTTTVTVTGTFAGSPYTFDVLDGADGSGTGDMSKATYDTTANGVVDNAEKVNSLTVETAVPALAVFTDTTYTDSQIKTKYEGNPDTNGYTDAEKALVAAVPNKADTTTVASNLSLKADKLDTYDRFTIDDKFNAIAKLTQVAIQSTDYVVGNLEMVPVDTSSGPISITLLSLPTPENSVVLYDYSHTFGVNAMSIISPDSSIMGTPVAEPMVVDVTNQYVLLMYLEDEWRILL